MTGFQLDLQGTGRLVDVTDEKLAPPIVLQNIRADGKFLYFEFLDGDGDRDKWEVESIDANRASFR